MNRDKYQILSEQQRLVRIHGMVSPQLKKYPNVDHVGVGVKEVSGELTDELCFRVYVTEKKPKEALRKDEIIPPRILGVKTDVLVKEKAFMVQDSSKYSSLRGGIMIRNESYEHAGNNDRGAGTLGIIVKHTASGLLKGLTCQHVVADAVDQSIVNAINIKIGHPRYITCCCCCTYNEIGHVHSAQKDATLDCALVTLDDDILSKINSEGTVNKIEGIGDVVGVAQAVCFERVRKRGAKTELTEGTVIDVLYEGSQILIRSNSPTAFADFGDSGAVLVNNTLEVVGLLWAAVRNDQVYLGNPLPTQVALTRNFGVANHIGPVMTALGFTVAGEAVGTLAVPASSCGSSVSSSSSSSSG